MLFLESVCEIGEPTLLLLLSTVGDVGEATSLDPWESLVRFFFRNPSDGIKLVSLPFRFCGTHDSGWEKGSEEANVLVLALHGSGEGGRGGMMRD